MGSGSFDVKVYEIQAKESKVSQNSGFSAKSMCDEFNPSVVSTRFSKKGPFNEFKDVITVLIGLDVTGSMDIIPKSLLQGKLGSLMLDLKKTFNNPNENLQISFAGMGDAKSDQAPLQVTHFESDNRFAQQLQKIWLEGGGGGNGAESYNLLWWYAANKTHLNYVKDDKRKGILITIGDDNVHPDLTANEIQMWLDPTYDGGNISNKVLLEAAREQYDVYHIVITDGNAYKYDYIQKKNKTQMQKEQEAQEWKNLLGVNNVIYTTSNSVADSIGKIIKQHRPLQKEKMINLSQEEWSKKNKEELTNEQWKDILSYTMCPLTFTFMEHPVTWGDHKKAYEKQAIENYVRDHKIDPITREKMLLSTVIFKPNLNIAQLCLSYKPFFDVLPNERKEQLIQSLRNEQNEGNEENERNKQPEIISNNSSIFFSNSNDNKNNNKLEETVKKLESMQSNLECPITHEVMRDPVILIATGQTYERKAIEQWLDLHDTDPLTGKKLDNKTIIVNYALKRLCDESYSSNGLNKN